MASGVTAEHDDVALRVRNLVVEIETNRGIGRPVDGISFDLARGRTLGLVGESGSGKSMTALALMGLLPTPPARVRSGSIHLGDTDLLALPAEGMRRFRGRHISMVMQDPMTALNPVFTIRQQIYEPLRVHLGMREPALRARATELLRRLQIPDPEARLSQYPHQFSGGMRQRVVGAIALACDPQVLIADEPTTALDVTIQAAYLDLVRDLQIEQKLAVLFITHDFGVVSRVCDRVAVMYAGRIVEEGDTASTFARPMHPYTRALIRSVPDVRDDVDRLPTIPGSPPLLFERPGGCPFRPRCELYKQLGNPDRCRDETPPLRSVATGQVAACHFAETAKGRETANGRELPSRGLGRSQ